MDKYEKKWKECNTYKISAITFFYFIFIILLCRCKYIVRKSGQQVDATVRMWDAASPTNGHNP